MHQLVKNITAKIIAFTRDHTAATVKKMRSSCLRVRDALLPAWYLRNGMISAAESELEDASESCELWSKWCACLVVVSIVAEFVIAVVEPPYGLFLKLSAATDAGVAIGIVGEVMLGMRNNRIQTELRKRSNDRLAEVEFANGFLEERAAQAHERAAKLEKEAADARERTAKIERLTAWRHIPTEHRDEIIASLRSAEPPLRLFFEYQNGDQEAYSYAGEISGVFIDAGIASSISHTQNLWMQGGLFGASISVAPDVDISAILVPFEAAGVALTVIPWNPLKLWPIPQGQPHPNVLICVYLKPPPEFPGPAKAD